MKRIRRVTDRNKLKENDFVVVDCGNGELLLVQMQFSMVTEDNILGKDVEVLTGHGSKSYSAWDVVQSRKNGYIKILGIYTSFTEADLDSLKDEYAEYFI